jgi:competence ComEA-like helix-hairpin-helix protein
MRWKDFFYFGKGERNGMWVLLLIITLSIILVRVVNLPQEKAPQDVAAEPQYVVNPANAPKPVPFDTAATPPSLPRKPALRPSSTPSSTSSARRQSFPKAEKYPAGTKVELNTADTASLKKVPGIGSAFARRIATYRSKLGGFYTVEQLREVYGLEDDERFLPLKDWFYADTSFIAKLPVNYLPPDSLAKHPYLNYRQARIICQLRKQNVLSGWENLSLLDEFTDADRERLSAYLSFYYKK